MTLAVALLVALGIVFVFAGLARMVSAPTRTDAVVQQYSRPKTMEEMELEQPFSARVMRPVLRRLADFSMRFTPQQVMESTRRKLDLAGNPHNLSPLEFLGLRAMFIVIGTLVLTAVFAALRASGLAVLGLGFAGAILGFYLPILWLDSKIRERQESILLELPDALDLMAVCADAGLGLDACFAQIATKWNNHLSRAISRMIFELRIGRPREFALRQLATRAEVRELTDFVAAILQAERFGAGVVQVLHIQSEQMRVLRRQHAQARANQLPVKLLFPLTIFIFPSILIVVLGPAMIRLWETFMK